MDRSVRATSSSAEPSDGEAHAGGLQRLLARSQAESWLDLLFVPVVLVAVLMWLSISTDGFLTDGNIQNILLQGAVLALVAFAMTFVILSGELDLSVGSGVALTSSVTALVARDTGSVELAVVAAIATGAAVGLVNGLVVTKLEVPSFIATLGMLVIAHGLALALTDGAVIGQLPGDIDTLASDSFLGIPLLIWLVAAVFVVLFLLQSRTSFGVKVMAVGGNREASRLSALSVNRVKLLCFVTVGVSVGIAGFALTSRVESGQPNAGELLALTSIAAVVIGGTSLLGGRGSVTRTLWGVLLIAVLENGLDVKGVNIDLKQVVIGGVFIIAASVDFFRRRVQQRIAEGRVATDPGAERAPRPIDRKTRPVP
jgi:ribose transport system permease protein